MSNLDEISTAIGALQAESRNATKERERLHGQLAEISKSIHSVQTALEKLCAARGVERRVVAKIAGAVALVFSAATAAVAKYIWD